MVFLFPHQQFAENPEVYRVFRTQRWTQHVCHGHSRRAVMTRMCDENQRGSKAPWHPVVRPMRMLPWLMRASGRAPKGFQQAVQQCVSDDVADGHIANARAFARLWMNPMPSLLRRSADVRCGSSGASAAPLPPAGPHRGRGRQLRAQHPAGAAARRLRRWGSGVFATRYARPADPGTRCSAGLGDFPLRGHGCCP
jgi:hypothetical protein